MLSWNEIRRSHPSHALSDRIETRHSKVTSNLCSETLRTSHLTVGFASATLETRKSAVSARKRPSDLFIGFPPERTNCDFPLTLVEFRPFIKFPLYRQPTWPFSIARSRVEKHRAVGRPGQSVGHPLRLASTSLRSAQRDPSRHPSLGTPSRAKAHGQGPRPESRGRGVDIPDFGTIFGQPYSI